MHSKTASGKYQQVALRVIQQPAVGDKEDTDKDIEVGGANIVFGSAGQWLSDINGRKLCSLEVCRTPKS